MLKVRLGTALLTFDSVDTFGNALWHSLYGAGPPKGESSREDVVRELSDTPLLLIVDDLDSVIDDEDLAHFLLFEIPTSKSKIVYTSRQRVPGLQTVEVLGFSEDELDPFVRSRAREYDLNLEDCLGRLAANPFSD